MSYHVFVHYPNGTVEPMETSAPMARNDYLVLAGTRYMVQTVTHVARLDQPAETHVVVGQVS